MIYVVSGFMRSGTSMMMQALMAGGMEAAYDIERERMNDIYGDGYFRVNNYGFYEIKVKKYNDLDFPLKYENKLIKVMFWGLPIMHTHNYKIVFMLRDFEEIRQSFEAAFGHKLGVDKDTYHSRMKQYIGLMKNRKDVELKVFEFRDVVDNTLEHFELLKQAGWPINSVKASKAVDNSQVRFRLENLDAGISNL